MLVGTAEALQFIVGEPGSGGGLGCEEIDVLYFEWDHSL